MIPRFLYLRLLGITLLITMVHAYLVLGFPSSEWGAASEAPLPQPFTVRTVSPQPQLPAQTKSPTTHKAPLTAPPKTSLSETSYTTSATILSEVVDKVTNETSTTHSAEKTDPSRAAVIMPTPPPDYSAEEWVAPTPPAATAFAYPDSLQMEFTTHGKYRFIPVSGGSASLVWSKNSNQQYQVLFNATIPGLGTTSMISDGVVGSSGIEPTRYALKTPRSERAAHFRRDLGLITFSNNKPDAPLLAGAQDMASSIMYVASLLAGSANTYSAGSVIKVQTASVNKASVWSFTVIGNEHVHPPAGPMEATKVIVRSADHREYQMELWLAPSLQYLPIRIKITAENWFAESNLLYPPVAR